MPCQATASSGECDDLGAEQLAAPFHVKRTGLLDVFVGRDRSKKIAGIGETIGADRTAFRQPEAAAVILADIAPRRPIDQLDTKDHAARNDADFAGLDLEHAELGAKPHLVLLRDDQHLAVGVEEMLPLHRLGNEQHVSRHAGLRLGVARGGHREQPGDESQRSLRDRRRRPAQLPDRQIGFVARRRGADETGIDLLETAGVPHRRPDAVEPGALIGRLRRGERRAGELLGIKAVVHLLRRVPAHRKRAGQRLGLEAVAEPGHVFHCH